jgi:hypothetical protein
MIAKVLANKRWILYVLIGGLILGSFFFTKPYQINYAFSLLTGQSTAADIGQDFYGFRALILHLDPYPPLVDALKVIGVEWDIQNASTHPPTSYLLVAPVAFLPYPMAAAIWGWLMLAAILVSLRMYGLSWRWAALVTLLSTFWSPASFSLSQLTPLWLLGLAIAYRKRDHPFIAGIWIGFASLTKFLPAILLVPFLLRRKWSALAGFALVWFLALGILFVISPDAISRYFEVNQTNSLTTIERLDNGAMLPTLFRLANWPGLLLGIAFLGGIAYLGRKDWFTFEYLAVALLPIAWIYSVLPLLPGILRGRKQIPILLAFLISAILPPFTNISAIPVACVFLLYGIGQGCRTWSDRKTQSDLDGPEPSADAREAFF